MLNITDIVQTLKVLFKYCLCFVLGNQQVASNNCITDTTRYSVRHAGHLFCIEFESNGNCGHRSCLDSLSLCPLCPALQINHSRLTPGTYAAPVRAPSATA